MRRDAPRIGVEILLVGLVLALLAGAAGLIALAQKRAAAPRSVAVVAPPPEAKPAPIAEPPPDPEPLPEPPPPPPDPPPADLTAERVGAIAARVAQQKALAGEAERRAEEALRAARSASAQAAEWRSRTEKLKADLDATSALATQAEQQTDALARERDVLAEKRDQARSKLEGARLRAKDGVAVLPYKGPNGTWRRPIAIECRNGSAILQPGGPTFSMNDLAGFGDPRANSLVLAVARAMIRAKKTPTPDGAPSLPYIVFLVRPDGVKPYYAARTLLEPLGIHYGYELVDADWDIEFPDLNDPREWSDTAPLPSDATWPPPPSAMASAPGPGGGGNAPRGVGIGGSGRGATSGGGLAAGSPGPGGGFLPGPSMPGPAGPGFGGAGGGGAPRVAPPMGRGSMAERGTLPDGTPAWGRLGSRPDLGTAIDDPRELEALAQSAPAPDPTDADGLPLRPGFASELPTFEPSSGRRGGAGSLIGSDPRLGGRGNGWTPGGRVGIAQDAPGLSGRGDGPGRSVLSGPPGAGRPGPTGAGASRPRTLADLVDAPPDDADATDQDRTGGRTGSQQPAIGARRGGTGVGIADGTRPGQAPGGDHPGDLDGDSLPEGLVNVPRSPALSEAIARRQGLVAPRMPQVPDRSTPTGGAGSARGGSTSPGNAPSGAVAMGNAGGASGAPPSNGVPLPLGVPGMAGGAASGSGDPGGSGDGAGGGAGGAGGGIGLRARNLPLVVACDRSGVTVHPGGTRFELSAMARNEDALPAKLRAIVDEAQKADPEMGLRPRVTFLIKPGGESAYLKARWEVSLGTTYPTAYRMVDASASRLAGDLMGGTWK